GYAVRSTRLTCSSHSLSTRVTRSMSDDFVLMARSPPRSQSWIAPASRPALIAVRRASPSSSSTYHPYGLGYLVPRLALGASARGAGRAVRPGRRPSSLNSNRWPLLAARGPPRPARRLSRPVEAASRSHLQDQARVAVVGEEVVGPAHERREAVAEAGQVDEVQEQPAQPAHEAAQPQAQEETGELGDAGAAADDRHVAEVAVDERLRGAALQAPDDRARRVLAALDRDLGHLREQPALRVLRRRQVADHEDLGVTGQAQVGLHGHAEAPLELHAQRLAERVTAHACRPDDRLAGDELAGPQGDAVLADVHDGGAEPHVDAAAPQHALGVAAARVTEV